MDVTVTLTMTEAEASVTLPRLAEMLGAGVITISLPAAEHTPRRRSSKKVDATPAEEPAPPVKLVEVVDNTPSAFDTILAAQDPMPTEDETLTPAELRNGIKVLLIEQLGFVWARPNILEPYGHLDKVPDDKLAGLYAQAQTDALAAAIDAAEVA